MKTQVPSPFIAALCCMALLFNSCKRESGCIEETKHVYYHVLDAEKAKIPYTGSDTIAFVSADGDTATLVAQGRQIFIVTPEHQRPTLECPIPEKTYHYESIEINFRGGLPQLNHLLLRSFISEKYEAQTETAITVEANHTEIDNSGFRYIDSKVVPEDSILLAGSYRSGVYIGLPIKNVLFNYSDGILRFKDASNLIWTKIK